jgi:(p)ppGpp synthase/HD superfamily hydrolase
MDLALRARAAEGLSREGEMVATIERAIAIAVKAHEGQADKAGAPYIYHPLRVMLSLETLEERMAAVLHDVVEDGGVTLEQLRTEGFPDAVVGAVAALTKGDGEDYEAFIRRIGPNRLARRVKLADLRDNSDLSRIANPTERDQARLEKYRRAIAYLESLE